MATTLISLRLPQACFEKAARNGVPLSKLIKYGLNRLLLQYPYINDDIMTRLFRHGRYIDEVTNGSRKITKYRIDVVHLEFCRYNNINVTAACECAVLDFCSNK